MPYCSLELIHQPAENGRSPVVFLHGFPDSPLMWRDYVTPAERQQPWLRGRAIYLFAFPNRQARPTPIPTWRELRQGVLDIELANAFAHVFAHSPTRQLISIGHDLGGTYTWRYARAQVNPPFENSNSQFGHGS